MQSYEIYFLQANFFDAIFSHNYIIFGSVSVFGLFIRIAYCMAIQKEPSL